MKGYSKQQEKALLKIAKKNNGNISASSYREVMSNLKNTVKKQHDFSFEVKIKHIEEEKKYEFYIVGKHLSTNVYNSLHFRDKLRYKTAIKKAFNVARLIYKDQLPKVPHSYVELCPTLYLKRHRDDDGTSATLKIIRDMIVNLGTVVDDSREYMVMNIPNEIISKNWKIVMKVKY